MNAGFWLGVLDQGFIFAPLAIGVYLTFRVLDFPDLTVEGSFVLGAGVATRLILQGVDPWIGIIAAILAGLVAGCLTGILNTKLHIAPLLSGILIMIGLYSINLRIMGGKSMLSLLRINTVYSTVSRFGLSDLTAVLAISLPLLAVTILAVFMFMQTELGMALRATGDNEQMIRTLGVNTNLTKVLGLAIGNALVALSGALVAQFQSYSDVGMGIGMIVVGLASVIMGEVIVGNITLIRALIGCVVGSTVYRAVIAVVMWLGLPATDLKLFTAILVILAMSSPAIKQRLRGSDSAGRGQAADA